ncbi:MAG: flagellar M-ring protein FliF [Alphaproteobacteria bacterium]|nr:flagellar M-ring protein FliF [Alphaproteobacteria bacterium]
MIATFRRLGPARLGVMGAVVLMLLLFFVFVSLRVASPDMEMLYNNLSSQDTSAIAVKLDENNIAYTISEDGTQVSVGEEDMARSRLLLAREGLPSSGASGYELFDNQSGFGTTNFQDMMNKQRALEGELARTISALEPVSTARVHLVIPERELFSRETQPPSASVFVNLRGSIELTANQIQSIQALVASAVPGLKGSTVSVMDSAGNLLAKGGADDEGLMTVKAEEMRRKYEQRLTNSIENLVGRTVGFGKVRAMVTADLDFDRISQNEEIFDPESQVIRSSSLVEESGSEREPANENVGVENNLPNVGGDLLLDDQPTSQQNRLEETTNYEISKTVRNTIREAGAVNQLSVAVIVDGTYSTTEAGERVYEPRSEEQLSKIENIVRSAIGFDDSRGDSITVESMQFADIDAGQDMLGDDRIMGFEREDLLDAAEIVAVAVMIILVVLLVLQPMVGRLLEASSPAKNDEPTPQPDFLPGAQQNPALAAPRGSTDTAGFQPDELDEDDDSMIDMQKVQGQVKASSIKKVEDIVSNYPNETVSVIRNWMGQE